MLGHLLGLHWTVLQGCLTLREGAQLTSSPPTSHVLRSHPGWTDLHKHLQAVTQGVWPEGTLCRFAENDPRGEGH